MSRTMRPSADLVRELFDYEASTGVLRWRDSPSMLPHVRSRLAGTVAGSPSTLGYHSIKLHGRLYRAHHLVWLHLTGRWPTGEIDHINGRRSDNRVENLREATRSQNMANTSAYATNTSGFKGVSRRGNKWRAAIMINRRTVCLGSFASPMQAHEAYLSAATLAHGEFARAG